MKKKRSNCFGFRCSCSCSGGECSCIESEDEDAEIKRVRNDAENGANKQYRYISKPIC